MIRRDKIRDIVSRWILRNPEYGRLKESKKNLQSFLYELSWKGNEELKPYIKICNMENYISLGNSYWWWGENSISTYIAKSLSITDDVGYRYKNNIRLNDEVNLDLAISPLENTLSIDHKKLSRSDKLKLKSLAREVLVHTRVLRKCADCIFETLEHPNMTLPRIMKYYPDLINERK